MITQGSTVGKTKAFNGRMSSVLEGQGSLDEAFMPFEMLIWTFLNKTNHDKSKMVEGGAKWPVTCLVYINRISDLLLKSHSDRMDTLWVALLPLYLLFSACCCCRCWFDCSVSSRRIRPATSPFVCLWTIPPVSSLEAVTLHVCEYRINAAENCCKLKGMCTQHPHIYTQYTTS